MVIRAKVGFDLRGDERRTDVLPLVTDAGLASALRLRGSSSCCVFLGWVPTCRLGFNHILIFIPKRTAQGQRPKVPKAPVTAEARGDRVEALTSDHAAQQEEDLGLRNKLLNEPDNTNNSSRRVY